MEDTEDAQITFPPDELEEPKPKRKTCDAGIMKQAIVCFSAYGAGMAIGASAGFSAVTIPQLQKEASGDFYLTHDQISWFASLPTFATIPTCIFGGFLGQAFGRRLCLLLVAPIFAVSFIVQACASDVALFQFGRLLNGFAAGLLSSPASTYVSEISHPDWRTSFGAGIGISYLVGSLIVYTLGSLCHWRTLAGISAIFPLLSFFAGMFAPESPHWLVTKGRFSDARKALLWLQPYSMCHNVDEEIEKLKLSYSSKVSDSGLNYYALLLRRDVWKPLILMLVLSLIQQFCGLSTISFYAVNVLMDSNSSVNEYLGTIIFGATRLASQLLGSYLLLRFRRRHLFVASASMTALGMGLLALVNTLKNDDTENSSTIIGALPLVAINIAAIGYQFGISPISWSYAAELFPLDARAELAGLSNAFGNLSIFLVVKTYPNISNPDSLGIHGTYWIYTAVCLVNVIFGIFFLPETKGRHLDDINKDFEKINST